MNFTTIRTNFWSTVVAVVMTVVMTVAVVMAMVVQVERSGETLLFSHWRIFVVVDNQKGPKGRNRVNFSDFFIPENLLRCADGNPFLVDNSCGGDGHCGPGPEEWRDGET